MANAVKEKNIAFEIGLAKVSDTSPNQRPPHLSLDIEVVARESLRHKSVLLCASASEFNRVGGAVEAALRGD